jgi:hypothetical protein
MIKLFEFSPSSLGDSKQCCEDKEMKVRVQFRLNVKFLSYPSLLGHDSTPFKFWFSGSLGKPYSKQWVVPGPQVQPDCNCSQQIPIGTLWSAYNLSGTRKPISLIKLCSIEKRLWSVGCGKYCVCCHSLKKSKPTKIILLVKHFTNIFDQRITNSFLDHLTRVSHSWGDAGIVIWSAIVRSTTLCGSFYFQA